MEHLLSFACDLSASKMKCRHLRWGNAPLQCVPNVWFVRETFQILLCAHPRRQGAALETLLDAFDPSAAILALFRMVQSGWVISTMYSATVTTQTPITETILAR